MGMIGYVRQLTPFELASYRRNPKAIKQLLDEETMQVFPPVLRSAVARMEELMSSGQQNSPEGRELEARIQDWMSAPQSQAAVLSAHEEIDDKWLELGKTWHLLHFLLTGSADSAPPPLGNAILGGTPIGADVGYGPARFLTPRQVAEVAEALAAIDPAELARRFDPAAIHRANIYSYGGIDKDDYLSSCGALVEYYADAARNGNGMLLYIR
jgi:hypothetical protein